MSKRISLFGRKRFGELSGDDPVHDGKKDELLSLKLEQVNAEAQSSGSLQTLALDMIKPDPNQPRKTFRHIDSLAASIKEQGIIQPIIVTTKKSDGKYHIIAGERRYQAAQQAKLKSMPCIIRDEDDANIMILQLLENDQREDVSPIEESDAIKRLVDKTGFSQSQVAKELGRDSGWVSIRLGLQQSSDSLKRLVEEGLIEDVRTLHELRMFESENPDKAKNLMQRIRKNQVSGSYRQVIANARKSQKKSQPTRVRKVQKIEKVGDKLLVYTKSKHPVEFEVEPKVLLQFLASVTYD